MAKRPRKGDSTESSSNATLADPWQGAPVARSVVTQLNRLGCTCRSPRKTDASTPIGWFNISFYRPASGYWEKKDPLGQVTVVPPAIGFLYSDVIWPRGQLRDKEDGRLVSFVHASGGYDVDLAQGGRSERCLLAQFAELEESEIAYCLSFMDSSPDPAVYSIAHDSLRPNRIPHKLSRFLSAISYRPSF